MDSETEIDNLIPKNKSKLPKAVYFIIGNEFCERFSFYGMKAILYVYLVTYLKFGETAGISLVHAFTSFAYFCSLIGGVISDSYWGKYKTILYLSIVYSLGSVVMSLTSLPMFGAQWWGPAIGLLLLGFGTGGIKPCVASFGGDQFDPLHVKAIAAFFSMFYFSINAGSVLSMLLTPYMKENVRCFGQPTCYPLAFGVPAILMIIATVIFVSGSKLYKRVPPGSNVLAQMFRVITTAIKEKRRSVDSYEIHWLQYARPKYSASLISDIHSVLNVLKIFIPIPFFWMLYDQQASSWVGQALKMNGRCNLFGWKFTIDAAQMQTWNAVLILLMIPFFQKAVYPLVEKCGFRFRSLPRMGLGMLLASLSFIVAAILEYRISSSVMGLDPENPLKLICVENCVHILFQVPQIVILTSAEILVSITGLEFAYSQAPVTMKSVCQAAWLFTVAVGNLVVVIVTQINPLNYMRDLKHRDAYNYLLYSGILLLALALYGFLASGYAYLEDRKIPDAVIVIEEEDISDI